MVVLLSVYGADQSLSGRPADSNITPVELKR